MEPFGVMAGGAVPCIQVFNRPLSGAEKAAVMAYLAAKWDLE